MGLNFVARPRRAELDSPDDFVSVSLAQQDINWKEHDEQLILEYVDRVLDDVENTYKNLYFYKERGT